MAIQISANSRIFYTVLFVIASGLYLLYSAVIKGAADLDDYYFQSSTLISFLLLIAGLLGYFRNYSLLFYRISAGSLAVIASLHYLYYYMQSGFHSLLTPGYFIIYFYCSLFFWRSWQHIVFASSFLLITIIESSIFFELGQEAFFFSLLHGLGAVSISAIFMYQLWLRQQSKQGLGTLRSFLEFNNDPIFTYNGNTMDLVQMNPAALKLIETAETGRFLTSKEDILNRLQQRVALFIHSRSDHRQVVLSEQEQMDFCGRWFKSNLYYFKSAYKPAVLVALKDVTQEINLVGALKASDINQEFYEFLMQLAKQDILVEDFLHQAFQRWSQYLPGVKFAKVQQVGDQLEIIPADNILLIEPELPPILDVGRSINFGSEGGTFQVWLQINLLKDGLWMPLGFSSVGMLGVFALVPKIEIDHAIPVALTQSMAVRFFSVLGQVLHKQEQEQRFLYQRKIMAAFPDLVILLDKGGYYLEVAGGSDQDLFLPREAHIGKHIREVLPMHVVLLMEDAIHKSLRIGNVQVITYELVVRGEENHFETSITPIAEDKVLLVIQNHTEKTRIDGLIKAENHVLALLNEEADLEVAILRLLKGLESIAGDLFTTFFFLSPDDKTIQRCISASIPAEYGNQLAGLHIGPQEGTCGTAMFLKKRVITEDIRTDTKWAAYRNIAESYGLRSCVSQPVMNVEGKVYGSLAIYKKAPYKPSPQLILFIERAAAFVSLLFTTKASRLALQTSEQLYKGIVENNVDKILQYSVEGNILLVNKSFCELYSLEEHEFLGKNIFDLVPPDTRASLEEVFHKVAVKKEQVTEIRESITSDLQMHTIEWVNYPVLNHLNEVVAIQVVGRDISALKFAEQRIRRDEQLLKSINANVQDGIYRSEIKLGKLLYANKAFLKMFQYHTIDDIPDKSTTHLYANPEERRQLLNDPQLGMSIQNKEVRLKNSQQEEFWGMFSCVVSADENGVLFYDGVIKDTTEMRKAEQKIIQQNAALKKLNSEMDRFVYSVSHNLRAPLTSILGLINILKLDPKSLDQITQMMVISVEKLDNFIKDLIDYSKNSRLDLNPERIELHRLVQEIHESLRYIDKSGKIEFVMDIPSEETLVTDLSRFRLVVENLISNAFKYYNPLIERPEIKIKASTHKNQVFFEISDNGIGIEEEHRHRVFEMFYRANDKTQGSGLGLFIVKEAVERLGGSIKVESEVNVGTRFVLQVPNLSKSKAAELNKAFTDTL